MGAVYRQAPIVGDEGCVRLDGDAYIPAPVGPLAGRFSLLFDLQPHTLGEQTVFGTAESGGASLQLVSNAGCDRSRVRLELKDGAGRRLAADFAFSEALGKRILLTADPAGARLKAWELQPWGRQTEAPAAYIEQGAIPEFRFSEQPIFLGGCNLDGARVGSFTGRLANFAVFPRALSADRASAFRSASLTREMVDLPHPGRHRLDHEGVRLFLDDFEQLDGWASARRLAGPEVRAAAVIAYRWLCDRVPLLSRLSDHYGALLSFPDTNPDRALTDAVLEDEPTFLITRDRWEGDWLSATAFRTDMALWVGAVKRRVSWEAFVKFVRNKLGGGHYDPDDRQLWQRELSDLATAVRVGGETWLSVKMLTLVNTLRTAAYSCGLVAVAREGL